MEDLTTQILETAEHGAIGEQLGISAEDAKKGLGALLPVLTGATQGKVRQEGGLGALVDAIGSGGFEQLLGGEAVGDAMTQGNGILGDLFGSKDTSREVAAKAGEATGLDPSILKKLLPIAASLLMGFLSKQGNEGAAKDGEQGGLGDILGGMLDKDGDGSFIDDVLGGGLGGLFGGK